jgi:hypothetical protein
MCPMLLSHSPLSFVGSKTYKYFQIADTKNIILIIIFPLVLFVLVLLISKFCEISFRKISKFDFPEELITGGNDINCLDFYYFPRS